MNWGNCWHPKHRGLKWVHLAVIGRSLKQALKLFPKVIIVTLAGFNLPSFDAPFALPYGGTAIARVIAVHAFPLQFVITALDVFFKERGVLGQHP